MRAVCSERGTIWLSSLLPRLLSRGKLQLECLVPESQLGLEQLEQGQELPAFLEQPAKLVADLEEQEVALPTELQARVVHSSAQRQQLKAVAPSHLDSVRLERWVAWQAAVLD